MSDIVTRLRTYKDGGGLNAWDEAANLIEEQQEEIERLREKLEFVRTTVKHQLQDLEKLRAERDEARELLRQWVAHADRGALDGVDLGLMVKSEEWLEGV